jgi:hypothetical protein
MTVVYLSLAGEGWTSRPEEAASTANRERKSASR